MKPYQPYQAYEKALQLGERIPKLEGIILKDAFSSFYYARHIIKGRWELAEPIISKDAHLSYLYARYAIKGRLPDFMHNALLLSNNEYTKKYVEFIK